MVTLWNHQRKSDVCVYCMRCAFFTKSPNNRSAGSLNRRFGILLTSPEKSLLKWPVYNTDT